MVKQRLSKLELERLKQKGGRVIEKPVKANGTREHSNINVSLDSTGLAGPIKALAMTQDKATNNFNGLVDALKSRNCQLKVNRDSSGLINTIDVIYR